MVFNPIQPEPTRAQALMGVQRVLACQLINIHTAMPNTQTINYNYLQIDIIQLHIKISGPLCFCNHLLFELTHRARGAMRHQFLMR